MAKLKWTTAKRKIKDLIPYEHNPRILRDEQAKELRRSLERFDLAEIPAINTDNTIIAGHQRLKILSLLGRANKEIDVRIPNRKLTGDEVQEYNIRSNKNTGDWDYDKLANNFDIDDLLDWGFTEKELAGTGAGERDRGEVQFSEELLLEHNYIVLYFDNSLDWEVAQEKLKLKRVKDLIPRKGQPVGIGRVIKGADVVARLK